MSESRYWFGSNHGHINLRFNESISKYPEFVAPLYHSQTYEVYLPYDISLQSRASQIVDFNFSITFAPPVRGYFKFYYSTETPLLADDYEIESGVNITVKFTAFTRALRAFVPKGQNIGHIELRVVRRS